MMKRRAFLTAKTNFPIGCKVEFGGIAKKMLPSCLYSVSAYHLMYFGNAALVVVACFLWSKMTYVLIKKKKKLWDFVQRYWRVVQ